MSETLVVSQPAAGGKAPGMSRRKVRARYSAIRKLQQKRANGEEGFTLIELLVVIAIIGILSSVVLASLSTARQKSRDAKRVSDIGQIQLALELYFDASQTYPSTTPTGSAALSTVPVNRFSPDSVAVN